MAFYPHMTAYSAALAAVFTTRNSLQFGYNLGWTTNNGYREINCVNTATFHHLYMNLTVAPGAGDTRTFTIRKNLTNDNIAATVSDTGTFGSDTTNTTSVTAGDYLDLITSWTGTPANTNTSSTIVQESDNQFLFSNSGVTIAATIYNGLQSTGDYSTTESDISQVIPTSGTIKNLYARMAATLSSGSYVVTLYKNGSPTALTCTLDSANQANSDTSNTVTVAEGDLVSWEIARNAPNANRTVNIGCEFVADTAGEGILMTTTGTTAVTHTTESYLAWYQSSDTSSSTITARQAFGYHMTFKKIYAELGTAPGSGYTRTLSLNKNSSNVLSVAISDTNTSGSTSMDTPINLGDLLCISSVLDNASGASSTLKISLVYDGNASNNSGFMQLM